MAPKVSIGMPVYNGQDYIDDAIQAILRQSFDDYELIISDNCSTDNTPEICEELARREPRVRYIRQQENLGAIGNFNALVKLANGEYFKWAAHDDLMEPTFLEKCVAVLDSDDTIAWSHSQSDMIDANGRSFLEILSSDDEELRIDASGKVAWKGHPRAGIDSRDPVRRFKSVILGTNWCVDSYGLFRLETLKRTRLLLPFYGAEKVLLGEVSLLGRYQGVPELLFYQRVHDKASSNLATEAAQIDYMGAQNPLVSTRYTILKAHFGAVWRYRLSPTQKVRGLLAVLRYPLQIRKWRSVITKMLKRRGTGGGGRRVLQSAERSERAERSESAKAN